MSIKHLLITACLPLAACQSGPQPSASCKHVDGVLDGPHVPDKATAAAIASAVIAHTPGLEAARHNTLIVEDEGAYWAAFQTPVIPSDDPDVTITFGGGGLSMKIAKCDGAISDVHYQR